MSELAEARQRSTAMMQRCRESRLKSNPGGLGAALGAAGLGVGANTMSKQQYLTMAAEQYRHFQGWAHAIIQLIANRIGGQPLRVGRIVREPEVRRLEGMTLKGNTWQKQHAKQRLEQIHQRRPKDKKTPLNLKDYREQIELLPDHPILRLMQNPNPLQVRSTMLFSSIASLELTGRSYWWFTHRDPMTVDLGLIDNNDYQVWPIPSSWVEPLHGNNRLFEQWRITPPGGGTTIDVPGHEVGYMYYPDPSNPLGSLSPLYAQARAVVVDEAVLEAQRRGFANGLFPGLAITIGRDPDLPGGVQGSRPILKREQRAQIIAALKQQYRGVQNEGEPIILDGLIQAVHPVTSTPKEMSFRETGISSRDRLAQGWGINLISLGQIEGANRASSAMADTHLVTNCINPRLVMISEILTRWMPRLFDTAIPPEDTVVYFEPATAYDAEFEIDKDKAMLDRGCMSINEMRIKHGYPPVDGGDRAYIPNFGFIDMIPVPGSTGGSAGGGNESAASWDPSIIPFRLGA